MKNKKEKNCLNPFSNFLNNSLKEKKNGLNSSTQSSTNSKNEYNYSSSTSTSSTSSSTSTISTTSTFSTSSENSGKIVKKKKKNYSNKKVYSLPNCQICSSTGIKAFAICFNCDKIYLCSYCVKTCKICERTHCVKCYFHNKKHDCYDLSKYDTNSDSDSDSD